MKVTIEWNPGKEKESDVAHLYWQVRATHAQDIELKPGLDTRAIKVEFEKQAWKNFLPLDAQ
jgi:hypothetical protein